MIVPSKAPPRTGLRGLTALLVCLWAVSPAWADGADRLGDAKKTKLSNGMVVLAAHNDASDIAAASLFIRVDARREPKGRSGLRGLLQFMILSSIQGDVKETEDLALLQQDLEGGGILDASTDSEYVEFVAVVTTETLEDALNQFRHVFSPDLNAEGFDGAKKAALIALERRGTDAIEGSYRLFRRALDLAGASGDPLLGTPETIEAFTLERAQSFHRRWYVPANAVLSIVSPLPSSEATQMAADIFEGLPSGRPAGTWRPAAAGGARFSVRVEGNPRTPVASIVVGCPAPGMGSEDHNVAVVAAAILGEGDESRLAQDRDLYQSRDLNYLPRTFNENPTTILAGLRAEGHLAVQTEAAPWAIDDVKNHIVRHFDRLKREPIPPEELETAKRRAIRKFAMQHQTVRAQAFMLGRYETIGLGYDYRTKLARRIEAVTAEDVQRMARSHFRRWAVGLEMPLVESPDVVGRLGLAPSLPAASVRMAELLQQPE